MRNDTCSMVPDVFLHLCDGVHRALAAGGGCLLQCHGDTGDPSCATARMELEGLSQKAGYAQHTLKNRSWRMHDKERILKVSRFPASGFWCVNVMQGPSASDCCTRGFLRVGPWRCRPVAMSPPRSTGPPLQPTTKIEVYLAASHAHVDCTLTVHDAVLGLMKPPALLGLTHSLRHLETTLHLLFRLPTDDCPASDPALDR